MIAFIKGNVSAYGTDWLVIEQNGIGWRVYYPHTEAIHLNETIQIFTYMHITENDVSLFGFESQEEHDLFLRLISVKGLGPKTAINMLAHTTANRLIASIEQGDVNLLKTMPGIGAKTASQIILDLKGKLVQSKDSKESYSTEIHDACEALKNLGYKQGEITQAAKVMSESNSLSTEEYLKIGLQFLMKKKVGS